MSNYKNNVNIDFTEQPAVDIKNYKETEETKIVESAKRHVIRINDIALYRNIYAKKSVIKSNNLIKTPAKSIAIFCNEYIPAHFEARDYITYHLTINGTTYKVVPINSDKNGTKIIKTSDYDFDSTYVEYINEFITSAYITITINCPNKYETPFLSDFKVLVGDKDV